MLAMLRAVARLLGGATDARLPIVCVFGHPAMTLHTPLTDENEETRLDCRCYSSDAGLECVLTRDRPDVIITSGDRTRFPRLLRAPFAIRRRWLHYEVLPEPGRLGVEAYNAYLSTLLDSSAPAPCPLVTVFTPTYRTGERIQRPYDSLQEQTYTNWEWIVVDDSDDRGATFDLLSGLARREHRMQVFKASTHSGIIGKLKHWACSLGSGEILVELDHDDALTDTAIDLVVRGFQQFPKGGFLYTDCAEVRADGRNVTYRDGWAFGYGSYTDVPYKGKVYKAGSGGNINAKTIRYLSSAPNHLRAWRTSVYQAIGGHNRGLHVADDYELLVRTFLATRMIRVPKLGYIQHRGPTAQTLRFGEIQRHVRAIRSHYDAWIHARLLALGCDDFCWDAERGCSDYRLPNPPIEPHATLIATGL